jgi:hypothetical protein
MESDGLLEPALDSTAEMDNLDPEASAIGEENPMLEHDPMDSGAADATSEQVGGDEVATGGDTADPSNSGGGRKRKASAGKAIASPEVLDVRRGRTSTASASDSPNPDSKKAKTSKTPTKSPKVENFVPFASGAGENAENTK